MLAPADEAIVRRDPRLPGLEQLLDPARLDALAHVLRPSDGAGRSTLRYLRYKPGRSCLVGIARVTSRGTEHLLAKAFSLDADEKWSAARSDATACHEQRLRIALWPLAADRKLRGARWLLDPARAHEAHIALRMTWDAVDVLAYKPERRLVLRLAQAGRSLGVAKCYEPAQFARTLAVHAALAGHHLSLLTAPAGSHDRRQVMTLPWVTGAQLNPGTDSREHLSRAGAALASLHSLPVALPERTDSRVDDGGLQRGMLDVARLLPEHADELMNAYNTIVSARSERGSPNAALLHGDFYAKQLLVTSDGIRMLDLDDCRRGDPHTDLGNFAAHIERDVACGDYAAKAGASAIEALVSGYASTAQVSTALLDQCTAEALLRLAPQPFRDRAPHWPQLTMALVRRAVALVDVQRHQHSVIASSPSGREVISNAGIATDPTLAFVAPLLDVSVATSLLSQRTGPDTAYAVQVHRARLVRHKAGRRCLFAFDVQRGDERSVWLGKVRAKGTDRRAATIHHQLWQSGLACVAEPLGMVDHFHMTLQRAVSGLPMRTVLATTADPAVPAAAVAKATRALHEARVPLTRVWRLSDEVSVLTRTLDQAEALAGPELGALLRASEPALQRAADRLANRDVQRVIHRDLHHDQVLLDGELCWLVDLDLVTLGDPAVDFGNLVAHLVEHAWRHPDERAAMEAFAHAFLHAIADEDASTQAAVADYTLLALGRLAGICALRDDRRAHAPDVSARVLRLLQRRPATSPLAVLESACAA